MRAFLREPLLHFLVLGAALLGLNSMLGSWRRPVVEITQAAVQAQAEIVAKRIERPLTAAEKDKLAKEMLQEEILFREAQRRGLVSDNQVRGTLVAMMRTALKPAPAQPTDEDLKKLRDQLPAESTTLPEQISFEHVSFSTPELVPPDLLAKLRAGANPQGLGEPIRLSNPVTLTFRTQLDRLMGPEFTAELFKQNVQEWSGPFKSSRGVHFVRVLERHETQNMPFEQMRPMLESRWIKDREAAAVTQEVEKLKPDYRFVMPNLGGEGGE